MARIVLALLAVGITLMTSATVSIAQDQKPTDDQQLKLWYAQPAKRWIEALPVGNGRLGAMVFGGVSDEQIQFNEDSLWTGKPHEYQHEGAAKFLPQIRQLLWDGKQKEAEALAMQEFMSVPLRQTMYQPFGDLRIAFRRARECDRLPPGAEPQRRHGERELQAQRRDLPARSLLSLPDQVLVVRLTADKPGTSASSRKRPRRTRRRRRDQRAQHRSRCRASRRGRHQVRITVEAVAAGGKVTGEKDQLEVEGANSATLLLVAATSFLNFHDITSDSVAALRIGPQAA